MTIKAGLNRKEQVQCAKWLDEGIPAQDIAKKFSTTVDIVRKFTQKALDAAADKAKARTVSQAKTAESNRKQAAVLKEAIDLTKGDFE